VSEYPNTFVIIMTNPKTFVVSSQNPNKFLIVSGAYIPTHHAQSSSVPPSTSDHEDGASFASWATGWNEMVYTEDSTNPDITLGELLLVYFEWMSVHKVRAL
jgi:hypothetical protein